MANSTGDAGGSKALRSTLVSISSSQTSGNSARMRQWSAKAGGECRAWHQIFQPDKDCQRRSRSPSLPGGFGGPV
jgi:hypothetical protein